MIGDQQAILAKLNEIVAEQAAQRAAFEEHTRSVRKHRWLAVLAAVIEWRATMIAGSAFAIGWLKWPWRK